jgi:superfamily II DNA/RNA helicase
VVATPGHLLDPLTRTEHLLLSLKGKLDWLVLDEEDRLLDMGLGVTVHQIIQRVRANQSGPGSETVQNTMKKLARLAIVFALYSCSLATI